MQALQSDVIAICKYVKNSADIIESDRHYVLNILQSIDGIATDIVESGNAAVAVLNDLINYDKIESNALILQYTVLEPRPLLETTVKALQVQAKQGDIRLVVQLEASFINNFGSICKYGVLGDRLKLGQVIRNVLSNALKFSPKESEVMVRGTHIFSYAS
jgi:signal transduction histidine kinase